MIKIDQNKRNNLLNNLLIVTNFSMHAGGVTSYIKSLVESLRMNDYNATLITNNPVKTIEKMVAGIISFGIRDIARVNLTRIRAKKLVKKVRYFVKQHPIELIHTQEVISTAYLSDLSIPIVLTVHGPFSKEAKMLYPRSKNYVSYLQELEKIAYKRADRIIAVDQGQKEILLEEYKVSESKIEVIRNAVNTNIFKPRHIKDNSSSKNSKRYILVPRRLVPKNGVAVAIKAFYFLKDLDLELWIAGDGVERDYLAKLTYDLGLINKVKFLGEKSTEEMISLMNNATYIVIPSVPVSGVIEASSIAALEGMAMGKIVIASNIGGLKEIIDHKVTGYLFDVGDEKKLAEAIFELNRDYDLRKKIERNAREKIENEYSTDKWIIKVLKVYYDVINQEFQGR